MDWQKTIGRLERVARVATGIAFMVMIGAVLVQVLGRSVVGNSPVWTEELTRFALLYLAAFGAGLSFRSGDLVNVDLVCEALPGRWPKVLRFVSALLTSLLCLMLLLPAWTYTSIGRLQTSPALAWRMDFIHASIFVCILSLFVFSLARVLAVLAGRSDGLPANSQNQAS
ncbi:TRAP transporter small permease [Stappia sp. F7233]|uniref:TRAP transporter small permease protein n=1 Tax=Stappia albiluteola TaxID=2758565 RepID=A0A839AK89_9HYPH|nr:TRAP transporter small permease [Stappia albiluteola]MBA5779414.1 TRAP transporter small permease [Stappia albiluteola]